jgi:hypothetical protein
MVPVPHPVIEITGARVSFREDYLSAIWCIEAKIAS